MLKLKNQLTLKAITVAFSFVVILLCIGSCSDSVIEKEVSDIDVYKNPTFSVSEDAVTYTSLGNNYQILWEQFDRIGIFCSEVYPEAVNDKAVIHSAYVGQNRGVFKSDINWTKVRHTFYVYYPWRQEQSTNPATLKHCIERAQTQKGSNNSQHIGKNAFMYARSRSVVAGDGEISLDFTHTTSVFELSFKSEHAAVFGKPLTRVVIKADNGATLSGDYTIDIKSSSNNKPTFTNGCDSVVLNIEDAIMPDNSTDSLKAYVVINPTLMTSVTIRYTVGGVDYVLTKNINKTLEAQRVYKIITNVDYGAASATPNQIYLSPTKPSETVSVESTHAWSFAESCGVATTSCTGGNIGTTSVTLTRKTSLVDYTVYGNEIVTIKTLGENPKTSTFRVCNLHLDIPDTLYIGNPYSADTVVYIPDIVSFGGDAQFVVESFTSDGGWIQSMVYDNISGKMKTKVLRNTEERDRPGSVTVHHINDPTYKVTVPVLQNEFVYIPEFRYFVIDIDWCVRNSLDIDIAYMFEDNNPATPFENIPVGFGDLDEESSLVLPANFDSFHGGFTSSRRTVYYQLDESSPIQPFLIWGGDATQGQGETVYFDADLVRNSRDVPRYLNLGLYLTWWHHYPYVPEESWAVRVTLRCYKGGTMEPYLKEGITWTNNKTSFRNVGGEEVHNQSFLIELKHETVNTPSVFKTKFTYSAKIRYDRITHYGIMRDPNNPTIWSANRPLCVNNTDIHTNSTPLTEEEYDRIMKAKDKIAKQFSK